MSGQIANLLIEQLERVNTQTLVHMLTAEKRLLLLIEVLLGHAPLRGGRTRDYPFSTERLKACELVIHLQQLDWGHVPLSKAKELGSFNLPFIKINAFEVLVALQLLVLVQMRILKENTIEKDGAIKKEIESSQVMTWLVEELCPGQPHEMECILGMLGIPWDSQPRERNSNRLSLLPKLAKKLAAACRIQQLKVLGIQSLAQASNQEWIMSLEQVCKVLNVKPEEKKILCAPMLSTLGFQSKKVQTILDQCTRVHTQRGASFWISQNMARVRDLLYGDQLQASCPEYIDMVRTVMLDNDAKTILVMSTDCIMADQIKEFVQKKLYQDEAIAGSWIESNFPRLMPYWVSAKRGNDDMQGCLPEIELQFLTGLCPLELALDGGIDFKSPPENLKTKIDKKQVTPPGLASVNCIDDEQACSGVRGRQRLSTSEALPTWMHSHKGEGYSLAGAAYSLAAITYARVTSQSIASRLSERISRSIKPLDRQKELSEYQRAPGGEAARLVLMKIDGEQIGHRFLESNTVSRPALSVSLEALMREAWLAGLAEVLKQDTALNIVPALLVYFGGDDLLFVLAEHHLELFIQGFEQSLHSDDSGFKGSKFTFACVPIEEEPTDSSPGKQAISAVESVNLALEAAKEERRRRMQSTDLAQFKSSQWHEGQMMRGLISWHQS